MSRAMIITVGTGTGVEKEEAIRSLAHGIIASIRNSNPDYIVFFVTGESRKDTIPEIKNQHPKLPANELMLIEDMNDVNGIYEEISDKIKDLKSRGYDVVIDFTSGTKAMSASAVLAATSESVMLSYVAGKRIGGKVVRGEEQVLSYSPVKGIVDFQEKILRELFTAYQYESCLEIIRRIEEITSDPEVTEKLNKYRQLTEGYSFWDKFEHKKALERLRTFDNSLVNIGENKRILFGMEKGEYKDYRLLISDLLNNARRRMEEGKYDDAVARLYRITELIAQSVLRAKYEIESGGVDVWQLMTLGKLEKKTIEKYEMLRDEEGKIKLPLRKDFELLQDLEDEVGKKFLEDNRMKDMLAKRNSSILAHGLVPVEKEDAEKMFESVTEYVELVVKDASSLMEKAEFPKL
jgi:CRISPR-associated protein (TIGR02710 family)